MRHQLEAEEAEALLVQVRDRFVGSLLTLDGVHEIAAFVRYWLLEREVCPEGLVVAQDCGHVELRCADERDYVLVQAYFDVDGAHVTTRLLPGRALIGRAIEHDRSAPCCFG